MKFQIKVYSGGGSIAEDMQYLKYNLDGRPGGEHINDNLKPLYITSLVVISEDPLTVEIECEDCDISEYIGNTIDISYKKI